MSSRWNIGKRSNTLARLPRRKSSMNSSSFYWRRLSPIRTLCFWKLWLRRDITIWRSGYRTRSLVVSHGVHGQEVHPRYIDILYACADLEVGVGGSGPPSPLKNSFLNLCSKIRENMPYARPPANITLPTPGKIFWISTCYLYVHVKIATKYTSIHLFIQCQVHKKNY